MFVASLGVSLFFEWRVALFMAPVAPLTCGCMNLMNRVGTALLENNEI